MNDTRSIDLRPVATPGWRAIYLDSPSGHHAEPLVGWLIQEEISLDAMLGLSPDMPEPGWRERYIVAAVSGDEGSVTPAFECASFWCVLGPGEPDPTAEQESEERQRREQAHKRAADRPATT